MNRHRKLEGGRTSRRRQRQCNRVGQLSGDHYLSYLCDGHYDIEPTREEIVMDAMQGLAIAVASYVRGDDEFHTEFEAMIAKFDEECQSNGLSIAELFVLIEAVRRRHLTFLAMLVKCGLNGKIHKHRIAAAFKACKRYGCTGRVEIEAVLPLAERGQEVVIGNGGPEEMLRCVGSNTTDATTLPNENPMLDDGSKKKASTRHARRVHPDEAEPGLHMFLAMKPAVRPMVAAQA